MLHLTKLLVIAAALILISVPLHAATKVDSLLVELKTVSGTERVDVLNSLAALLLREDVEKSLPYAKKALNEARQLVYKDGIAKAQISLGHGMSNNGDQAKALEKFYQSLETLENDESNILTGINYIRIGSAHHRSGDNRTAIDFAKKAFVILSGLDDKFQTSAAANDAGYYFWRISTHDSALVYFNKALKLRKHISSPIDLASTYNNIGIINYQMGNYEVALEHYLIALPLQEDAGNKRGVSLIMSNIGKTYKDLGKINEAFPYFVNALKIGEVIKDNIAKGYALNNIATVLEAKCQYDSSLVYYNLSLDGYKAANDRKGVVLNLNNVAHVHYVMGNFKNAIHYSLRARQIAAEIEDGDGEATALKNLGLSYLHVGKVDMALDCFQKSVTISMKIGKRELLKENYEYMSQLYTKTGDYVNSMKHYMLFSSLKDSLLNEQVAHNIDRLKISFETEGKERENAALRVVQEAQNEIIRRNKTIIGLISLLLLSIIILSVVLFSMNGQKKKVITKLDKALGEVERLSITDELTELFNRRYFWNKLDDSIAIAKRHKRELSCAMIDLDYFKKVNDTYGHSFGDTVLKRTSNRIVSLCRTSDTVARYGGEEIIVLMPETSLEGALAVAEKICEEIKNVRYQPGGDASLIVTASIGVSCMTPSSASNLISSSDLVALADKALYRAKEDGRDRVVAAS